MSRWRAPCSRSRARHALRFPRHGETLHAKGQQAIRDLAGAMRDLTGNLPMLPGCHPVGNAKKTIQAESPFVVAPTPSATPSMKSYSPTGFEAHSRCQ